MQRYKRKYIECYIPDSDRWLKAIKEKQKEIIDGYEFHTVGISMFYEAVIRVDDYSDLLIKKLNKFYLKYQGEKLENKKIIELLNNEFKSYNIIFIFSSIKENDEENTGINLMDTGIKKGNIIDILIICNSLLNKMLIDNFKSFKEKFQILIKHELIHKGQFLKIADEDLRLKVLKDKQKTMAYMEQYHEIMAYANNIIEELRFDGYGDDKILQTVKDKKQNESGTLDLYINLFKIKEDKPEVLHRLYKYIYEYLKGK